MRSRGIRNGLLVWVLAFVASCSSGSTDSSGGSDTYLIGVGAADITGPVVDVEFNGFSRSTHIASGIQTRLTARAFIVGELDESRRFVFVVTDLLRSTHETRLSVVENLQERYGDLYSMENVVISATHTHSSPAGYVHRDGLVADTPEGAASSRFRREFFDSVAAGITEAVVEAHEMLAPGQILFGQRAVEDAGKQRSLPAYLANPEAERARYPHDTDREMTLLKFVQAEGREIGALNWFAVHPTSLTYNNPFVSGDHKAFAALEMERRLAVEERGPVVTAFANSNCGDVTSNLNLDNTGPGADDLESAGIIGSRQLDVAIALFDSVSEPLVGRVDIRQTTVEMSRVEVSEQWTGAGPQQTCSPARGYSFAAGSTEDGGGNPVFTEGMLEQDETIDALVRSSLGDEPPDASVLACHAPKPVLWTESRPPLPIGVATIGQLALVFIPGEVTTMAGRRMRDTVLGALGDEAEHAVIAAYSNEYSGYITTPEEYDTQQYEGGHTLFGRWTLSAYQQEIDRVARSLSEGTELPQGPDPGDVRSQAVSRPIGNEFDEPPMSASFGDVSEAPAESYAVGDQVSVSFWTGHPDNALRDSYFEFQVREEDGWRTVVSDSDWSTRARWTQANREIPPLDPLDPFPPPLPPSSEAFTVEIFWDVPAWISPGTYRAVFYGSERAAAGQDARLFTSTTPSFEIVASPEQP
jgi:neutral ceramidase